MAGNKEIIRILMERDDLTEKEATELLTDVREMMNEAIDAGDYIEAEMIFEDELGLEPDYIVDIL